MSPDRRRWASWVLLLILIPLAGLRYGIAPRLASLQKAREELRLQEQLVARQKEELRTFRPAPVKVPQGISLVPLTRAVPQMVSELVEAARSAGVEIVRLEMPPLPKPSPAEAPLLSEFSISISVRGSFPGIVRFAQGIEGSPWGLVIKDLGVKPADAPSALTAGLVITAPLIQQGEKLLAVHGISPPAAETSLSAELRSGGGPFEALLKPSRPQAATPKLPPLPPLPLPPPAAPPAPAEIPAPKPPQPPPALPQEAEPPLGITVIGIIVGPRSVAIVRLAAGTQVVGPGDVIGEGIQVLRISPDQVVVRRGEKVYTVRVGESK